MRDKIPKEEVVKWLNRLKSKIKDVKPIGKKGKEFLENIKAYAHDSEYFMEQGDVFLAWEACIWAWAYYTIGVDLGLLER